MFYIGIEDLAANALIQVIQEGKNFLTYKEIEQYGARVVRYLSEKNGRKAVLILSRESTHEMLRNYSAFFEEKEENGARGIALRAGKRVEDLIERFQGYLALDVLDAFIAEKVAC